MIVLYTWYFCFLISVSTNILQHIYCILWFLLPLLLRKGWGLVEENLVLLCKKLVQIRPHPVLIQRMASLRLTFLTNSLVTREKLDLFEMIVKEAQQDPGRVAWLWKRYCFVFRSQKDPTNLSVSLLQYFAFIDIDEALVPRKDFKTLTNLLQRLEEKVSLSKKYDAISFRNLYYPSSAVETYPTIGKFILDNPGQALAPKPHGEYDNIYKYSMLFMG